MDESKEEKGRKRNESEFSIKAHDIIFGASFVRPAKPGTRRNSYFAFINSWPARGHVIEMKIESELWTNKRAQTPHTIVANL